MKESQPNSGRSRRLPTQHPSVELARRAQGGDSSSLNELLRRYSQRIHRMASVRMGRRIRSFMDSTDLVQNTLYVAVRNFEHLELRSESSVIHWLSKILENQIRDAARYTRADCRDPERQVSFEREEGEWEAEGPTPTPLDQVTDRELQDLYDESLSALSEEYREVILLRDYAGMSWETIAEELERPSVSAVRSLFQRAKLKLSQEFDRRVGPGATGS